MLLAIYHAQGGSSAVGQPLRALIGMGRHEWMTPAQIDRALDFARSMRPQS